MRDLLRANQVSVKVVDSLQAFLESNEPLALTVLPIDQGAELAGLGVALITEQQLLGDKATPQKRRQRETRSSDASISQLSDLREGSPVVHIEHGIGRYMGLQKLNIGGMDAEFLTLIYSGDSKLYVPVSSLHLVSRYTGADVDAAPLDRLGSERWAKAKRRAAEQVRDVAAELLEIAVREVGGVVGLGGDLGLLAHLLGSA